jgi:hypothetical protein
MSRQPHGQLCFRGQLDLGRVEPRIQRSAAVKACGRARSANMLQHDFVADQRLAGPLAGPIGADQVEHAMFDRVPLGGSCGIMPDSDPSNRICRPGLAGPASRPNNGCHWRLGRRPVGRRPRLRQFASPRPAWRWLCEDRRAARPPGRQAARAGPPECWIACWKGRTKHRPWSTAGQWHVSLPEATHRGSAGRGSYKRTSGRRSRRFRDPCWRKQSRHDAPTPSST